MKEIHIMKDMDGEIPTLYRVTIRLILVRK